MGITVTTNRMTATIAPTVAVRLDNGKWAVSDRPNRELTDDHATLAMLLAQRAARGLPETPHTRSWEQQLRLATATPGGCQHCGIAERDHFQRWARDAGWHGWTQPTQGLIKERMLARRSA